MGESRGGVCSGGEGDLGLNGRLREDVTLLLVNEQVREAMVEVASAQGSNGRQGGTENAD